MKGLELPSLLIVVIHLKYFLNQKSNLILSNLFEYEPSVMIIFIDKDTKEWGQTLVSMEMFRKHPPHPNTYGKCTLVK